jgi:hypothetical protein
MVHATTEKLSPSTDGPGAAAAQDVHGFFSREGLRLRTSVRLRWLAVTGQLIALLFVHLWLGLTCRWAFA